MNPYEVLDVPRDADAATIKAAFRSKAQAAHPDKNPDDPDAHKRFQDIQEAYEILKNLARRAHYDATGGTDVPDQPVEERALALVKLVIGQVMNEIERGSVHGDFVSVMRQSLVNAKQHAVSERQACQARVAACERALKRYRFKGTGEDWVGTQLKMRQANAIKQADNMRKALEEFEAAVPMLDAMYEGISDQEAWEGAGPRRLSSSITFFS